MSVRAMNGILGTQLHPADRDYVLSAYTYRGTVENFGRNPAQAKRMRDGGFRMPLISDAEWLASTRFAVKKDGRLDHRVNSCFTER